MSAATPCVPCCSTPQSVNIPGLEGLPGTNGLNGQSAFTITLGDILIPAAPGSNVVAPVLVGSTSWMVVGQILIIGQGPGAALANPGPATFQVVAITNPTTLTLKYLGYPGDAGVGLLISTGAYVSPAGVQSATVANPLPVANGGTGGASVSAALTNLGLNTVPIAAYGSGAAYTITAVQAAVTMGGTSPAIVITTAGTWMLFARIRFDYVGKTFAANHTLTAKLRRTNNTPADVTNATASAVTPIITTQTYTHLAYSLPPVVYVTVNATDAIALYAAIDVLPAEAGTVTVPECEVVAVRLF